MRFMIDILVNNQHTITYKIGAKSEEEAIEKLSLRFPPSQLNMIHIDNITPYPAI